MRLSSDELKEAFRMRVRAAPNPERIGCPEVDVLGGIFLSGTPERGRLDLIDHVGRCLPCARELAAVRVLYAGHARMVPLLPTRYAGEAAPVEARPEEPVGWLEVLTHRWWRLMRPGFALATAASAVLGLLLGVAVYRMESSGAGELTAIAPIERATAANLALEWAPLEGAAAYEVRMHWPNGRTFFESERIAASRLELPGAVVAKMKRGQTCLWTLRALDESGRLLAERTFAFEVAFDPPAA